MSALGHDADDTGTITDHLIDCELRRLGYGGPARAISIAERISRGLIARPRSLESAVYFHDHLKAATAARRIPIVFSMKKGLSGTTRRRQY